MKYVAILYDSIFTNNVTLNINVGYDVVDGVKIPREDEQAVIKEMLAMRKAGATYRGIADWMAQTQERKMTFMGVKRVLVMEGVA